MFFSDRITLRAETTTTDAYGDPVKTFADTEVWAEKASVTRSEFYSATAAGLKVDAVFRVHVEDWGGQTAVVYDSDNYTIVRAYQKGEGVVELMCATTEAI